jgi:hypothetical protein
VGWQAWSATGILATFALCVAHGWAIWHASGGSQELLSPWPLARDDHPVHFHYTTITPRFLRSSGTTAGYDPSFMSGYAKSVIFPQSSSFLEIVAFLSPGASPPVRYKLTVFFMVSSLPWLVALAGWAVGARPWAQAIGVCLYLNYIWGDFPINYAGWGMTTYILVVPLALVTAAILFRYVERGGWYWWLAAVCSSSLVLLAHPTAPMIVVPAALAAYAYACARPDSYLTWKRHLGFWSIGLLALLMNAFWWLPGLWLSSTAGESGFVFAHPEPIGGRLLKIFHAAPPGRPEPPIESALWFVGLPGLVLLVKARPFVGYTALAFVGTGFFWGYLAGGFRSLDFLQPGRQTYAFYTALALVSGVSLSAFVGALFRRQRALGIASAILLAGLFWWWLHAHLDRSLRSHLNPVQPMLSSRPAPQLQWVVNRLKKYVRPGDRLLYEEGGFDIRGLRDPFQFGLQHGRYSGLIPYLVPGVELLGGPYLHVALKTNFTQFGEGRLFGKEEWTDNDFRRYAKLYRPSAILCWTPRSTHFCRTHPDLIQVVEDDGVLLIGRVLGYEGSAIRGEAEVRAEPGKLRVRVLSGELDGLAVLRYHFVPCLRSSPSVPLVPVYLEDDPVPFIGIRPTPFEVTIEMTFPPK